MTTQADIIPTDERDRLAAVRRYQILDTPRDGAFDRITELAARVFDVPIAIVSIVDEDRIWFKSHHGVDVDEVGRDPGLCASAILQDDPWIVGDAASDPRTLANPLVAGDLGLRFYAGAPLTTWDGHNLGTMCVIDQQPREIEPEDVATLQHLAGVVVHELELRLATRTVVENEREKQALIAARHSMEAAERERTRWARELHDETLQSLGALQMMLASAGSSGASLETALVDAANFVQDEVVKLRHLIAELRPAVLDEAGLGPAIESLGRRLRVVDGVEVAVDVDIARDDDPLAPEIESTLYRVVQEALTNVAKHAAARRAEVVMRRLSSGIELTVADDGLGFDAAAGADGFGLIGMRERAMLAGGELEVRSEPGRGTTVRFVVPLAASVVEQSVLPRELDELE
jgi:signal transduction histidine kinase